MPLDSFANWSAKNQFDSPLDALKAYNDYSRTEYMKEGTLTPEVSADVERSSFEYAVQNGWLPQPANEEEFSGAFEEFTKRSNAPSSNDLRRVIDDLVSQNRVEDSDKIRKIMSLQRAKDQIPADEYAARLRAAQDEAKDLLTPEAVRESKFTSVKNGTNKLAAVEQDGKWRIEASPELADLTDKEIAEYAQAHSDLVDSRALPNIKAYLNKAEGYDMSPAQMRRASDLRKDIIALAKTDQHAADQLAGNVRNFEHENNATMDNVVNAAGEILTAPFIAASQAAERAKNFFTGQPDTIKTVGTLPVQYDEAANQLSANLKGYSKEEIASALKDMATLKAINTVEFDAAKPEAVARKLSDGSYVIPDRVLANKTLYDKVVSKLPLTADQKSAMDEDRTERAELIARNVIPKMIESGVSGFEDFYDAQKEKGKSDSDILDEFTKDNKNYNSFLNRAENVGISALSALVDTGVALGHYATKDLPYVGEQFDKAARSASNKLREEKAANAALAAQFGDDFGWAQELSEQVLPLVADIAITKGAAKGGRFATAAARESAEKLSTRFLSEATRDAVADFGNKAASRFTASETGKKVADNIARALSSAPEDIALMATQGARTWGSTYADMYSNLETMKNPDGSNKYTPEQIRQMSTDAATRNAFISNAITFGFNKIGGGKLAGAEAGVFEKGLSTKGLRSFYDDVVKGVKNLPDDVAGKIPLENFDEFKKGVVKNALSPAVRFFEHGAGEAGEEFLQQIAEDVIKKSTANEDIDLRQLAKGATLAASYGFALGGGAPAVTDAAQDLLTSTTDRRIAAEDALIGRTVERLNASGSPLTAAWLELQRQTARASDQTLRQRFTDFARERSEADAASKERASAKQFDEWRANNLNKPLGLPAPEEGTPEQLADLRATERSLARIDEITDRITKEYGEELTDAQKQRVSELATQRQRVADRLEQQRNEIAGGVIRAGSTQAPLSPTEVRDFAAQRAAQEAQAPAIAAPLAETAQVAREGLPALPREVGGQFEMPFMDRWASLDDDIDEETSNQIALVQQEFGFVPEAVESSVVAQLTPSERSMRAIVQNTTPEERRAFLTKSFTRQQRFKEIGQQVEVMDTQLAVIEQDIAAATQRAESMRAQVAPADERKAAIYTRQANEAEAEVAALTEEKASLEASKNTLLTAATQQIIEPVVSAAEVTSVIEAAADTGTDDTTRELRKAEAVKRTIEVLAVTEAPAETLAAAVAQATAAPEAIPTGSIPVKEILDEVAQTSAEARNNRVGIVQVADAKIAEAKTKFTKADVLPLLSGKDMGNGTAATKEFIANTNDASGFLTASDFDLFIDYLSSAQVPNIAQLQTQLSYNGPVYTAPFYRTLKKEVEEAYPTYEAPAPVDVKVVDDLEFNQTVWLSSEGERLQNRKTQLESRFTQLVALLQNASAEERKVLRKDAKRVGDALERVNNAIATRVKEGDYQMPREASYAERRSTQFKAREAGKVQWIKLPVVQTENGEYVGYHTNKPVDAARLLNNGFGIKVPKAQRESVNPNIQLDSKGNVKAVTLPDGRVVQRVGDLSSNTSNRYVPAELKEVTNNGKLSVPFMQFTFGLPEVPSSLTNLMGATALGNSSVGNVMLNEQVWINDAQAAMVGDYREGFSSAKFDSKMRAIESFLALNDMDSSDFIQATISRYVRDMREFALAVRIQEERDMGRDVVSFLNRVVNDDVKQQLQAAYRSKNKKTPSVEQALSAYATDLVNELNGTKTEGNTRFSKKQSDGSRVATPNALVTTIDQTFAKFRLAAEQRGVSITTIENKTFNEETLSQAQADELASTMMASSIDDAIALQSSTETEAEVAPSDPVALVVSNIENNPQLRAAFDRTAAALGIKNPQRLAANDILEVVRGEWTDTMREAARNARAFVNSPEGIESRRQIMAALEPIRQMEAEIKKFNDAQAARSAAQKMRTKDRELRRLSDATDTTPTKVEVELSVQPEPVSDAALVTLPSGKVYTRDGLRELANAAKIMSENDSVNETKRGTYAQMANYLNGLLKSRKRKFTVGTDVQQVFNSIAVFTGEEVVTIIRDNSIELQELQLESGNSDSVNRALRNITGRLKPLADALLLHKNLWAGVNVEIVTAMNSGYAAQYLKNSDTIVINKAATNGRGIADALIHELIHVVSSESIRNPKNAKTVARLEKLRNEVREAAREAEAMTDEIREATSSLDEFISYSLTSPDFQKAVADFGDSRNLMQRIIDFVKSLFGISRTDALSNAFDDMLRLSGIENPMPYGRKAQQDVARAQSLDIRSFVAPAELASEDTMLKHFQSVTPASVKLVFNEDLGSAASIFPDDLETIHVNPNSIRREISGMTERNAQSFIKSIITHEMAHLASLKVLTAEELSAMGRSLPESTMARVLDEYYGAVISDNVDRRLQISRDLREGRLTPLQIGAEYTRMQMEKMSKGYTSEADYAFYRRNPSVLRDIIRAAVAFINQLRARIENVFDAKTAATLQRMVNELNKLQTGEAIASNPFEAVAQVQDGKTPLMTLPVYETENAEYKIGKAAKYFQGELKPTEQAVVDERDNTLRLASRVIEQFNKRIQKADKNGLLSESDKTLLRDAMGNTDVLFTNEDRMRLNERTDKMFAEAELRYDASEKTDADLNALQAENARITEFGKQQVLEIQKTRAKEIRDRASAAIQLLHPEVGDAIDDVRAFLDKMSGTIAESPYLADDLRMAIDTNMGIYLRRSFRAYTQDGWVNMLKSADEVKIGNETVNFAKMRDNALKHFLRNATTRLRAEFTEAHPEASPDTVTRMIEKPAMEEAQRAFNNFVENFDKNVAGLTTATVAGGDIADLLFSNADFNKYKGRSSEFKKELDRFMQKQDIPAWLRELMGEVTDPVENMIRSVASVSRLAANQRMLETLRKNGLEAGWMTTNPEVAREKGYVKLSSDDRLAFADLYAPKEFKDAMDVLFTRNAPELADASTGAIRTATRIAQKVAGASMGAKTLLSVGFYTRNLMSDFLFFGPLQGVLMNPANLQRWTQSGGLGFSKAGNTEEDYIRELIQLGVLGDSSNSQAVRDMIKGFTLDADNTLKAIENGVVNSFDEGRMQKLKKAGGNVLEFGSKLNDTIGAYLRIGLFEHEFETLRNAYATELAESKGEAHEQLLSDLKKEAARKVLLTTQSHSQQFPIVRAFTKSGLGSLFAPFVRFKAEMLRVMVNTPKLAFEEMQSENEVIRSRGKQRLASMVGTLTVMPSLVAGTVSTLFAAAFGDDDDKKQRQLSELMKDFFLPRTFADVRRDVALQAGLPDWQKGNVVYFAPEGDQMRYIDLSFIVPFSLYTDPFVKSYEYAVAGQADKIDEVFSNWVSSKLIGEQIAVGAAMDAFKDNKDAFGRPIAAAEDSASVALAKKLFYTLDKSFTPPLAMFAKNVVTGERGSRRPTDEDARNANRLEIIAGELAGVRPRSAEITDLYERASRANAASYSESRRVLGVLKATRPVTDAELIDAVNYANEARAAVMSRQKEYMRQYETLGLSKRELSTLARDSGFSKERVNQIINTDMVNRYWLSRDALKDVYDAGQKADGSGAHRLETVIKAMRATPEQMKLDP